MIKFWWRFSQCSILGGWLVLIVSLAGQAHAAGEFNASQVYAKIDYISRIADGLLKEEGLDQVPIPKAYEKAVSVAHVYELHVSTIRQVYTYAVKNDFTPPLLTTSFPINYTFDDVIQLTNILADKSKRFYDRRFSFVPFTTRRFSDKTEADVYDALFEVYFKFLLLNGMPDAAINDIYADAKRAKEDLQSVLLTLSRWFDPKEESKKRQLVTAVYGLNPDGSVMQEPSGSESVADILARLLSIRSELNQLKSSLGLEVFPIPSPSNFPQPVGADAFLQIEFVISEINLLKVKYGISQATNTPVETSDASATDVYQELIHIGYMLERLSEVTL